MKEFGMTVEQINNIFVENPARAFSYILELALRWINPILANLS